MSPSQGTGAEMTCLWELCKGWSSGVCLSDSLCLVLLYCHVSCPGDNQVVTRSALARPGLSESRSEAQSPEGPSVPHFCFHSLIAPCLLEAPLTASAFRPGCPGALSCPQAN